MPERALGGDCVNLELTTLVSDPATPVDGRSRAGQVTQIDGYPRTWALPTTAAADSPQLRNGRFPAPIAGQTCVNLTVVAGGGALYPGTNWALLFGQTPHNRWGCASPRLV